MLPAPSLEPEALKQAKEPRLLAWRNGKEIPTGHTSAPRSPLLPLDQTLNLTTAQPRDADQRHGARPTRPILKHVLAFVHVRPGARFLVRFRIDLFLSGGPAHPAVRAARGRVNPLSAVPPWTNIQSARLADVAVQPL